LRSADEGLGVVDSRFVYACLGGRIIELGSRGNAVLYESCLSDEFEPALLLIRPSLRQCCASLLEFGFGLFSECLPVGDGAFRFCQLSVKVAVLEPGDNFTRSHSASGIDAEVFQSPGDLGADGSLPVSDNISGCGQYLESGASRVDSSPAHFDLRHCCRTPHSITDQASACENRKYGPKNDYADTTSRTFVIIPVNF
jgi:hypothetical protein